MLKLFETQFDDHISQDRTSESDRSESSWEREWRLNLNRLAEDRSRKSQSVSCFSWTLFFSVQWNVIKRSKILEQSFKSNSKRLFQIVSHFIQLANIVEIILKFDWLNHVNIFFDFVVKKKCFEVHLLDLSIVDDNDDVNNLVAHRHDHRDEDFRVIQFFYLFEISHHLSRLKAQNLFSIITFDFVNSFVTKNLSIFRRWLKLSDVVDQQKIVFFYHCFFSLRDIEIRNDFVVIFRLADLDVFRDFNASHAIKNHQVE